MHTVLTNPGFWQKSVKLVLSSLLLAVIVNGCSINRVVYGSRSSYLLDTTIYNVEYGIVGEEVQFAVFSKAKGSLKLTGISWYSVGDTRYVQSALITFGGRQQDLLKSGGVYQVTDGVAEKWRLNFTANDLKGFLKEDPQEISVRAFAAYLSKNKK